METNTAATAAADNAIMKYGMTTMTKGSLEEFAARMSGIFNTCNKGIFTISEMMELALNCINQYPNYPSAQVRYLEMLDTYTSEVIDCIKR